jgi:hypothetical protein
MLAGGGIILIEIRDLRKPDWLVSSRPIKAFRVEICDDILESGDGLQSSAVRRP